MEGCVRVPVCLFTSSDVESDRRAVCEGFLLCSHCKVVECAWSQTRKHCSLTENLLHLQEHTSTHKPCMNMSGYYGITLRTALVPGGNGFEQKA